MKRITLWFSAVLVLAVWLLCYRLGEPAFYHLRKESRRAQIAQEMITTGDWLVPQLEEEPIFTKPPLYYWAVALLSRKSGVTEYTARVPSAAAGIGTVVFTFLIGSLLFSRQVGLQAALALLGTNFFLHQARYAEMESMLAFFITAALYFFLKGYYCRQQASRWFALCWIMMGCGMITKGPFALTFPLISIIGYLWVYKEKKLLVQKPFLRGLLFFLAVALPWPLAVARDNPRFLLIALWETVGRTVTGFVHREPFYYYVDELDSTLFPWIFCLPFALALVFSQRLRHGRAPNVFLLWWFIGNLVFLSLSKSKRDFYLYPVTPAVALLVASTWQVFWEWASAGLVRLRWVTRRTVCAAGVVCMGASFAVGNPWAVNIPELHFPEAAPFLAFAGVLMAGVVCLRALLPRQPADKIGFAIIIALMIIFHFLYFTYTVPIRNAEESGRQFYRAAARIVGPDVPLAFLCGYENYTFTFYARRPLVTLEDEQELERFMNEEEPRFAVLTTRTYKKIKKKGTAFGRVLFATDAAEHDSWGGYVLVRNRFTGADPVRK